MFQLNQNNQNILFGRHKLVKHLNNINNKLDENGLPIETPIVSNKPFKFKGKKLDYKPVEMVSEKNNSNNLTYFSQIINKNTCF